MKVSTSAPEATLVEALTSFLSARLKPTDPGFAEFLAKGDDGKQHLTALGKSALMDVLTAEDGVLLDQARTQTASPDPNRRIGPTLGIDPRDFNARAGSLAGAVAAVRNPAAFDGAHQVAAFDWGALDREAALTGVADSLCSLAALVGADAVSLGRVTPSSFRAPLNRHLRAEIRARLSENAPVECSE
jgi:hypothetical protein